MKMAKLLLRHLLGLHLRHLLPTTSTITMFKLLFILYITSQSLITPCHSYRTFTSSSSNSESSNSNLTSTIRTRRGHPTGGPRLVISPENAVIRRPVKKGFFLTCKGEGSKPDLFTDLKWFDPNGDEIDRRNRKVIIKSEPERLLLIFREPTSNDGGIYKCRGKFQFTEALEAQVDISFYQDVTFEDCPTVQSLVKGRKDGYIKCLVTANPPPIITWSKDELGSESFDKNGRYIIENNGIRVRNEVSEEDAGRYDVSARVEETGEVLYQFITVDVYVTPHVETITQDRDATEGDEVILHCKTSGIPVPLVTWFDPLKRNLSTVGGYYVDRDRGSLTITKVRRSEDSGVLTCRAENAVGFHESTHNLVVITKPSVTSFENVTGVAFNEASFECRATGIPAPRLSIRADGSNIPLIQGKDGIVIEERHSGDESVLILTFTSVQRKHDGLYYCSAENKGAISERVGHLTVEFAPDLSRSVSVVKTWDANPVNLTCIADAIPNATISWVWRGQRLEEIRNPSYEIRNERGISNLLVKPLGFQGSGGGDVFGTYRCEAINTHGRSAKEITLERAYPPSTPGPIVVLKSTSTTLEFDIATPGNDGGLPIRRLVVSYRREHYDDARAFTWPATGGPYRLDNLIPRMSYMMKFAAENDVGIGYWSPEQRIIMPFEEPPVTDNRIFDSSVSSAPSTIHHGHTGAMTILNNGSHFFILILSSLYYYFNHHHHHG